MAVFNLSSVVVLDRSSVLVIAWFLMRDRVPVCVESTLRFARITLSLPGACNRKDTLEELYLCSIHNWILNANSCFVSWLCVPRFRTIPYIVCSPFLDVWPYILASF